MKKGSLLILPDRRISSRGDVNLDGLPVEIKNLQLLNSYKYQFKKKTASAVFFLLIIDV